MNEYIYCFIRYILAIIFLPFLFLVIIPAGMEMGGLGVLGIIFIINFLIMLIALIISIAKINRDEDTGTIFLLSIVLSLILSFVVCAHFSREPKLISGEEKYELLEENFNKRKSECSKLLKRATLVFPDERCVERDKMLIQKEMNDFLEDVIGELRDSVRISYRSSFVTFFRMNDDYFFKEDKSDLYDNFFKPIKNTMGLNILTYSPDLRFLIVVFTYDYGIRKDKFDYVSGSACFLCEKISENIYLYPQRWLSESGGISKEAAYYYTVDKLIESGLSNYPLIERYFKSGLSKRENFWNNKMYFSKVISTKTRKMDYIFKMEHNKQLRGHTYEEKPYLVTNSD